MRVLLLSDVKGVGRRHEIKEVSDGYGRNFLIAKKLAIVADARAQQLKKDLDQKESALLEKHRRAAEAVKKIRVEFQVKTGDKGEVFGSVSQGEIKKALQMKGFEADVILGQPLKTLGTHSVTLNFGRGIKGEVKVELKPAA